MIVNQWIDYYQFIISKSFILEINEQFYQYSNECQWCSIITAITMIVIWFSCWEMRRNEDTATIRSDRTVDSFDFIFIFYSILLFFTARTEGHSKSLDWTLSTVNIFHSEIQIRKTILMILPNQSNKTN